VSLRAAGEGISCQQRDYFLCVEKQDGILIYLGTVSPMDLKVENNLQIQRRPEWLRKKSGIPAGTNVDTILKELGLFTICREARCPNQAECYSLGTATFLILGHKCTRNCKFCSVTNAHPEPPDSSEPSRVATAVERLGLKYVVMTSPTRDDLKDGGSQHFAETIHCLKSRLPDIKIEVLIPDFNGDTNSLAKVLDAKPDVLGHNIETIDKLYPSVRPGADYKQSLRLLESAQRMKPQVVTKSGIMVGLGETNQQVVQTLKDLHSAGVSILTIGQYLKPAAGLHPVKRYVTPEEFEFLRSEALRIGFLAVASGPYVRSSYHAHSLYKIAKEEIPCNE
jgi:lipoic acid synthetase